MPGSRPGAVRAAGAAPTSRRPAPRRRRARSMPASGALVEPERAPRQASSPRDPPPVRDDRPPPQAVAAGRRARGGGGVADEHQPPAGGPRDDGGDLGRDVHPVGDQRHAGPRVGEEGGERRGPAALDAAHGVEGVGHEARAGADRRASRLGVGVGVAHRHDAPRAARCAGSRPGPPGARGRASRWPARRRRAAGRPPRGRGRAAPRPGGRPPAPGPGRGPRGARRGSRPPGVGRQLAARVVANWRVGRARTRPADSRRSDRLIRVGQKAVTPIAGRASAMVSSAPGPSPPRGRRSR